MRLMTGFSTTVTTNRLPTEIDPHVLEKAGGVKRFQRFVDFQGIGPLARPDTDIADDRLAYRHAGCLAQRRRRRPFGRGAWLEVAMDTPPAPAAPPKARPRGRRSCTRRGSKFHAIRDLPSPLRPPLLSKRPSASAHTNARILHVLETFKELFIHLQTPRRPSRMLFPASVSEQPRSFAPQYAQGQRPPAPQTPHARAHSLPAMSFRMIASGYGRKLVRIRAILIRRFSARH